MKRFVFENSKNDRYKRKINLQNPLRNAKERLTKKMHSLRISILSNKRNCTLERQRLLHNEKAYLGGRPML